MGLDIKEDVKQVIDGNQNIIRMVQPEGQEPVIFETYADDMLNILYQSAQIMFSPDVQIDISKARINNVMYSFTNPTHIGYGSSKQYSDITSYNIDLNKVGNEAKYLRMTNTTDTSHPVTFKDYIFYKIACTNQNSAAKAKTTFGGIIDVPGMGLGYVMIDIGPGLIDDDVIMTQTSYYFSFDTITASGNVSVTTSYFSIPANVKIEICK